MTTDSESITVNLTITANPAAPRTPLKISTSTSSSSLRQLVSKKTKIPLGKLRLIYAGKLIKDNDSNQAVSEYRLEEGSVLHCMGQPEASAAAPSQPAASVPAGSSVSMPAATAAASVPAAPSGDPLQAAFSTMRSSNPPGVYMNAVTTLDKILSNIVGNPMEEKYRRVKKKNAAFQRRLGGLPGGDAAMDAAGFTSEVHEGEEVYMMQASAEKWPQLMASKSAVEAAVRDATAANNQASAPPPNMMGGLPGAGGMPGFGNMPGMNPGDMNNAMNGIMSDPNALQAMLQNPMVQNMMRNDPRFANNPMMQQGMEQLANNPAMIEQFTQMMRDPNMQQQMQSMMNDRGMASPGMMNPGMFGMPNNNMGGAANSNNNVGGSSGPNNNNNGANDQQQTEDELIAEAIRRSLEDGSSS